MPEPGSLGSDMGQAGADAGHGGVGVGGDGGSGSFPTDPAAYDDDLSAFGGPGDPAHGVGGEFDAGAEREAGDWARVPVIGDILGLGQALAITVSRAFGLGYKPQGVVYRELYQPAYAHLPGYAAHEKALFDEAFRRVDASGLPANHPQSIRTTEEIFREAMEMGRWGVDFKTIERTISRGNPYAVGEGEIDPRGPQYFFDSEPMPNPRFDPDLLPEDDPGGLRLPGEAPYIDASFIGGAGRDRLFGGAGTDTLARGPGAVVSTESGAFVVRPDGGAAPLGQVLQGIARVVTTGGSLSGTQLALVARMTPEQRRSAGIFMRPDGTVLSGEQALQGAVRNLAAGQPLSANQQAVLGLAFNNIASSSDRRDAIVRLSQATGIDTRTLNQAIGQSMRAAAANSAAAATQTATQSRADIPATRRAILDVIGRDTTFKTRAGKVVDARTVVNNALQNIAAGRPLTDNQQAVLREYRQATGSKLGRPQTQTFTTESGEARTRAQVLANAARNRAAGRPLTANQKLALRQEQNTRMTPQPVARPATAREATKVLAARTFKTASGQTRTTQQVLKNAAQNQAAGRPLTANQKTALKQVKVAPKPAPKPTPKRAAATPKPAPKPVPKPAPKPTYTTKSGQTRTTKQVLANAAQNKAAGKPLTKNQKTALKQQAKTTPKPAPKPAPKRAAAPPKPAPKKAAATYTTKSGQTRTTKQVLANAARNKKAGKPLTANQVKALAAKKKAKKKK